MSINVVFKRFKDVRAYYGILGVSPRSTKKEIKDKFLKLSMIYHPDNTETGNQAKFVEIKEAFDAIKSNPGYDKPQPVPSPFTANYNQDRRPPPIKVRREPLNMRHIHKVYETMNKEEEPEFRPMADHTYPGTPFNRFEFSRSWDPEKGGWVYLKRPTAEAYNKDMAKKGKRLQQGVRLFMLTTLLLILNFKMGGSMEFGMNAPIRPKEPGMFVLDEGEGQS